MSLPQLDNDVEHHLKMCRVRHSLELMRDYLHAVLSSDPQVTVTPGDRNWGSIDVWRSGIHVARIFAKRGLIKVDNVLPGSAPGTYGPKIRLTDRGEWALTVMSEEDVELLLQCTTDMIAHLGNRRVLHPNSTWRGSQGELTSGGGHRVGISRSVRFAVLARDNFACQYCGRRSPEVTLHVDHCNPASHGGSDDKNNLKTSCVDCNLGKGNRFKT